MQAEGIGKLDYDDKNLSTFNEYLNVQYPDFPIAKTTYSRALFDYEIDTYRTKYNDYISGLEEDEDVAEEIYDSFTFWSINRLDLLTTFCSENNLNKPKIVTLFDLHWENVDDISNNDIIDAMFVKPDIEEREVVLGEMKSKMLTMREQVKALKQ